MRVLVIEDEEKIANLIKRGLQANKFVVDIAADGEEGLFKADINPYDAIVLDLMLPKMDGMSVCRKLRKSGNNTPILMLTARDAVKDRITGLDSGADDYLSKPFSFEELIARVKALLRRQRDKKIDQLEIADLHMNLLTREVNRSGRELGLTNKEFMLLEYFMLHPNQVLTRTMISEHVWQENFNSFSNLIDVHIRYLRNKVDNGFKKKLIHTIRGTGYVLKGEDTNVLSKNKK